MFKPSTVMPLRWEYSIWYLFLVAWMQGMALLNVAWVLLLIASFRYLPFAWQCLQQFPTFYRLVGLFEVVRVLTALFADFPAEAALGLFDDLRAITIGVAALVFLRSFTALVRAGWASFIGLTILGWWSLAWQMWYYGLHTDVRGIFGSFAHLNYAAAYSMIAMMIMLVFFVRLRLASRWWMWLGIVPLAIMQLPLGSRTTMLVGVLGAGLFVLLVRQWRAFWVVTIIVSVSVIGLANLSNGLSQFGSMGAVKSQLEEGHGMPSMEIRMEIWGLLFQIFKDHPLGIGPRNHGYIDLTPYSDWMRQHMVFSIEAVYGIDVLTEPFTAMDANQHRLTYDPHSQYLDTLVDGGVAGLLLLLLLYAMPVVLVWNRWGTALSDSAMVMVWMLSWSSFTIAVFHQSGLIIFFLVCATLMSNKFHLEGRE